MRAAWLLRAHRTAARLSRAQLVARLRRHGVTASTRSLAEVENGRRRSARVTSWYELALELPAGTLVAPVDILYRTFASSPPDLAPVPGPRSIAGRVAVLDALDSEPLSGSDWWQWAHLVEEVPVPTRELLRQTQRLASELGRSVGTGYPLRYEALSRIRCGPQGNVVIEVARRAFEHPHVQAIADLASAVSEKVDPQGWDWAVAQLSDHRANVVHAGVIAIENMASLRDFDADLWFGLSEPFVGAYNAAAGEPWSLLCHLFHLIPRQHADGLRRYLGRPPAPPTELPHLSETRVNTHWSRCQAHAQALSANFGLPDEDLLARLMFDALFGSAETTAVTSGILLTSAPYAEQVAASLADTAARTAEAALRERAWKRLVGMNSGCAPPARASGHQPVVPLLAHLLLLAQAGQAPDPTDLQNALVFNPTELRRVLYAAGMSASPVLHQWRDAEDPVLAGTAAWWIDEGARVCDERSDEPAG
ncbi:hypothetical protein BWI15_07850 [Kribbella sp. ALI-6-A]|nr:hypothetical protein BWI15_07850 [Kribbella sp. ALI-6-A]